MKALILLAALLSALPAYSEVTIEDAGWELSIRMRRQNPSFHRIDTWMFPPSPEPKRSRPRAYVTLKNPGSKPENAVLLRFAFFSSLRKIGTNADGIWTVPFLVEEKRVPTVKAGKSMEVPLPLNRVALDSYLKRMYRAGFWPGALRVRVMIEPRPGESLDGRVIETTLPISWQPAFGVKESDERSETAP